MFSRLGDDWIGPVITGNAVLSFPEIGIELPLGEAYAGIEFPGIAAEDEPISP